MVRLGLRRPKRRRTRSGYGWALRNPVSDRVTVVARTLIRTSSAFGTGRSTSSIRRTSGGPYLSKTTAFIDGDYRIPRVALASSGAVLATRQLCKPASTIDVSAAPLLNPLRAC